MLEAKEGEAKALVNAGAKGWCRGPKIGPSLARPFLVRNSDEHRKIFRNTTILNSHGQ